MSIAMNSIPGSIYSKLFFLALIVSFASCISDRAVQSNYSPEYLTNFDILSAPKTPSSFSRLVVEGLTLDSIKGPKLMAIMNTFESKRGSLSKSDPEMTRITAEREASLEALLTKTELEQLRFIKLRFNNFALKNPKQVTNIQKAVGMSDGQVLKYIEIVERFKRGGDKPQMHLRLKELLGDKFNALFQQGIFYK